MDEGRNLLVCPLPHDYSFMQIFYEGVRIVQVLCATDFKEPNEAQLPSPIHRAVARMWVERRNLPVSDVVHEVAIFSQAELLDTSNEEIESVPFDSDTAPSTSTIISPFPRYVVE